jgi:hypothetical protein
MYYDLIPHPDTPPNAVTSVRVLFGKEQRPFWFEYELRAPGGLMLPGMTKRERADDLWKTTCLELFVQPVGSEGYLEFNFSPSFQWAAYAFSGYRSGRRDLPSHDPEIVISPAEEYFFLAVEAMPDLPPTALKIGFSAVIEEADGTKSYWALAHPPGKPDFHHPDCFTLEVPAASHP